MAEIYDYETGNEIAAGLQGCNVCDEAIQAAQRIADERGEDVHLVDDDGEWIVHPMIDGKRKAATPIDKSTGMWVVVDATNHITSVSDLRAEYPGLVAYDESGFEVDLDALDADDEALADAGYFPRSARRILLWACEADSQDDSGARAVASATWIDR